MPDEQLDDYRQWLDNDRRLRELVAELEALTLAIADTARASANHPVNTPKAVARRCLTCGQPGHQCQSPQVTVKCEDLTSHARPSANAAGQVCTSKTSTLHRATPLRLTRASAVIKETLRASAKATY